MCKQEYKPGHILYLAHLGWRSLLSGAHETDIAVNLLSTVTEFSNFRNYLIHLILGLYFHLYYTTISEECTTLTHADQNHPEQVADADAYHSNNLGHGVVSTIGSLLKTFRIRRSARCIAVVKSDAYNSVLKPNQKLGKIIIL